MTLDDIENIKQRGAISELKAEIMEKIITARMAWDCVYSSDDEFICFEEAASQVCRAIAEARLMFYELQNLEPDTHK